MVAGAPQANVPSGLEVVERPPALCDGLALRIQYAQAGLGGDAADAVDRCLRGGACGLHGSALAHGCGKAQFVVIAAGQGALLQ
ncbi:hypothetical protein D3C71_1803250 [compost metagenome]